MSSGFLIPNAFAGGAPSTSYGDQAEPDSVDFDIIAEGVRGNGVLSGCVVTAQGTPDNTVAVAAGVVVIDGARVTVNAQTSPTLTADSSKPRFYLVCANNVGAVTVTAGLADDNCVFPVIPANSAVLAAAYMPAGAATVTTAQINSKRMLLPSAYVGASVALGRTTVAGTVLGATTSLTETGGASKTLVDIDGATTYSGTSASGAAHNTAKFSQTVTASVALGSTTGVGAAHTIAGAANIADGAGMRAVLTATHVSPAVSTLLSGLDASVVFTGTSGGATKVVGLRGRITGTTAGTVTDAVGLEITTIAVGATKWGMQVGDFQSYHQGAVRIGTALAPDANSVLHINRARTVGAATDRAVLIDSAVTVQNAAANHYSLHVTTAVTGATAKSAVVAAVTLAPTFSTALSSGAGEFSGLISTPQQIAGSVDLLIGHHVFPKLSGTGGALFVIGTHAEYTNAGSGSAAAAVAFSSAATGWTHGLWILGAVPNRIEGALMIGSNADPQASAVLDLTSTTKAFLPPRMTTTQRNAIATPADGMVIYNTTTERLQERSGGAWRNIGAAPTVEQGTAVGGATVANAANRADVAFVGQGVYVKDDSSNAKVDVQVTRSVGVVPRSGHWLNVPEVSVTGAGTPHVAFGGGSTGELILAPWYVPHRDGALVAWSQFAVWVTAAFTVSTAPRVVMYSCDSDGYPTLRVFDDAIAAAGATPTSLTITANNSLATTTLASSLLPPPGKYWIGLWCRGTVPTVGTFHVCNNSVPGVPRTTAPVISSVQAAASLRVTTSAVVNNATSPSDLSGATFATGGNMPVIFAKVA